MSGGSRRQDAGKAASVVVSLCLAGAVLLPLFLASGPWPTAPRDHLAERGVAESGALNLVSAIYLGYRAFDTLGEAIVLLVAIAGTIAILAKGGASLAEGFSGTAPDGPSSSAPVRPGAHSRTSLLDVVTGKLGPVVLIFGVYVMTWGHLSPGGGFQGGVVIASGIVFLAIGRRSGARILVTDPKFLARAEALAFSLLVLASLAGFAFGTGFFGDPFAREGGGNATFIVALNSIIGLKVGTGMGFMCVAMLGRSR